MATATDTTAAEEFLRRNRHLMGPDAAAWTPDQAMAWLGLLLTHRVLSRGFGKAVESTAGLSPTALSLLGRLSEEPNGRLRTSALSDEVGLSLSRTSRVVDLLESHGLVQRASCPSDARATNVVLLDAGRALVAEAQSASSAWVHEHFLSRLTEEETASLASIFERFAVDHSASACSTLAAEPEADEACGGPAC